MWHMSMPHTCRCGICGHLMSAPGLMGFGSFGPSLLVQPRAMLIGDLQTWALYEDCEVVDQAAYEAWCAASLKWSFGDSQSDANGVKNG
jgi:hypothetical protein